MSQAARNPGRIYGPAIEDALRNTPFTMRHYMQAYRCSTLGGWIATRSGGHYATLYTHIDDFVESTRVVTPEGTLETRRLPGSGARPQPRPDVHRLRGHFWDHHRGLGAPAQEADLPASASVRSATSMRAPMRCATSPRPASIRQLPTARGARGAARNPVEQRGGRAGPGFRIGRPSARRLDEARAGDLCPRMAASPTRATTTRTRIAPARPVPGATSSSARRTMANMRWPAHPLLDLRDRDDLGAHARLPREDHEDRQGFDQGGDRPRRHGDLPLHPRLSRRALSYFTFERPVRPEEGRPSAVHGDPLDLHRRDRRAWRHDHASPCGGRFHRPFYYKATAPNCSPGRCAAPRRAGPERA